MEASFVFTHFFSVAPRVFLTAVTPVPHCSAVAGQEHCKRDHVTRLAWLLQLLD